MANQELLNYIKQARTAGQTDEQIKVALLEIGWDQKDADEGLGFSQVSSAENPSQKVSNRTIFIAVGIVVLVFFAIIIAGIYFGFMDARKKAQEKKENPISTPAAQTSSDIKPEEVASALAENSADKTAEEKNVPAGGDKASSTLPNTFSDDTYGFSVNYPDNWNYKKDAKDEFVQFSPSPSTNDGTLVFIGNLGTSNLSSNTKNFAFLLFSSMISSLPDAKKYDQKGFIYNFDDGKTLAGEQWKNELKTKDGKSFKVWIITFPYEDTGFIFMYGAPLEKYDVYSSQVIDMLNSWKIMEK